MYTHIHVCMHACIHIQIINVNIHIHQQYSQYYTLQISNWWLRDFHTDINTTSLSKKKRKAGCQLDPMKAKHSSSATVSQPPATFMENTASTVTVNSSGLQETMDDCGQSAPEAPTPNQPDSEPGNKCPHCFLELAFQLITMSGLVVARKLAKGIAQ